MAHIVAFAIGQLLDSKVHTVKWIDIGFDLDLKIQKFKQKKIQQNTTKNQ